MLIKKIFFYVILASYVLPVGLSSGFYHVLQDIAPRTEKDYRHRVKVVSDGLEDSSQYKYWPFKSGDLVNHSIWLNNDILDKLKQEKSKKKINMGIKKITQ